MENKKVERFLRGFKEEQELQDDSSKPGDPQLSALSTFLQSKIDFGKTDVIVDFGCGKGIMAQVINSIWKNPVEVPFYIAVDIEELITTVSFPTRVHNNSMKLLVEDFYTNFPKDRIENIKLVVIRNVFHELNIIDTSRLIQFLSTFKGNFDIFIQDMQNLPKAERGKAGWDPQILLQLLESCYFKSSLSTYESFGGTKWFSIITTPTKSTLKIEEVTALTAKHREIQKGLILKKISDLNNSKNIDESDIVSLQNDNSSLDLQLLEYNAQKSSSNSDDIFFNFRNNPIIPLVHKSSEEFAISSEDFYKKNGLIGLLINKNIIDFSKLLLNCQRVVRLLGYSNSSLFHNTDTRNALRTLLKSKSIEIRILICNPDSYVASLRNSESIYTETQLVYTIKDTLKRYKEFFEELSEEERHRIELRIFDKIAYTSIVLFDDYCLVSNYSNRISGSSGHCYIYHNNTNCTHNTYKVIEQEFQYRWDESTKYI